MIDEEDIKNIKPLPNLDYKIMQGNSLKIIIASMTRNIEAYFDGGDCLAAKSTEVKTIDSEFSMTEEEYNAYSY